MDERANYDVIVLGAGPAGYVAAIRAAQLGKRVAVVERESLGGVCLNWGCIPTKSLLRNAEVIELLGQGKEYGFKVDNLSIDYSIAQKRSRQVSDRLVKGIGFLFKKNNIAHIAGTGQFTGPRQIRVSPSGQLLEAEKIIIATGAHARSLPGVAIDGKRIITSRQALELTAAPKRLIVVGAGAIGMEFAYLFRAYGAEVTVIEMLPHVLPLEDEETAAEVAKAFKKRGIEIRVGARTESVQVNDAGVSVRVKDLSSAEEAIIDADMVLMAIGVAPNSQDIGLEAAGVAVDKRGFIGIDETMRTNVPGIYAIGDVTGKLLLAHVGSAQGIVAAEHLSGHDTRPIRPADYEFMPRATYCHPQVASLGLTEAQAKERGLAVNIGKFPFVANGKSLGLNNREGFVKLITDSKYGEILGAHLVGPEVTELLPELALAHTWELTADEIAGTVHAHPSLSEAIMEAAHATRNMAIHI